MAGELRELSEWKAARIGCIKKYPAQNRRTLVGVRRTYANKINEHVPKVGSKPCKARFEGGFTCSCGSDVVATIERGWWCRNLGCA